MVIISKNLCRWRVLCSMGMCVYGESELHNWTQTPVTGPLCLWSCKQSEIGSRCQQLAGDCGLELYLCASHGRGWTEWRQMPTTWLCMYIFSLVDLHPVQRTEQDEAIGAVCVHVNASCVTQVAGHIPACGKYMWSLSTCLLGMYFHLWYWLDLGHEATAALSLSGCQITEPQNHLVRRDL